MLAGGLSTTIHITIDAPGNSARLVLTGVEEVADIMQARSQSEGLRTEAMIGNKGCDAERLKKICRMSTRHDTLARNPVSLLTHHVHLAGVIIRRPYSFLKKES